LGTEVQRRPIAIRDLMSTSWVFLGIAAILVLIAGAGAESATLIIIALIMVGAASTGFIINRTLEALFPTLSVSAVLGVTTFIWSIEALARGGSHWTRWLMLLGGLISLSAAYIAYTYEMRGAPSRS